MKRAKFSMVVSDEVWRLFCAHYFWVAETNRYCRVSVPGGHRGQPPLEIWPILKEAPLPPNQKANRIESNWAVFFMRDKCSIRLAARGRKCRRVELNQTHMTKDITKAHNKRHEIVTQIWFTIRRDSTHLETEEVLIQRCKRNSGWQGVFVGLVDHSIRLKVHFFFWFL